MTNNNSESVGVVVEQERLKTRTNRQKCNNCSNLIAYRRHELLCEHFHNRHGISAIVQSIDFDNFAEFQVIYN
jgi:hypothetical protein